ncbi:E3 ubiquitin-protein ligase TRIM39-like [Bufo gargarizans]|uniref:E3 ubiquitin-protein ligase TRIM39-like n=1 Tax=Bufo gargarizans TaxID=30331 RepID=UPI001CF498CD|nr:E3 ubiquitin-protein ligase TRIM39-like [Bufo gargarizans]
MASAELRDELNCSICLNIYTDPVTLRCGHNFCRGCIDLALNSQRRSRVYNCPDCRQVFNQRPSLCTNVTLRSIVKHFQPPPGQRGKAGVICTYCLHCPVPAVKSCVLCEASLCGRHLKAHNKSPEHVLIEPTTSLENRKCSTHKKILEYYCPKDQVCICVYCRVDGDHNGHQVQSLDEASKEKKKKLTKVLETLTSKKKEAETKIQNLQERLKKEKGKAAKIKGKVNALFTDLRKQLEDVERRVLSEISGQEKQVSVFILDQIQQLDIKKNHLSNKMCEIEERCKMTDPITVLLDPKCENNWVQEDHNDQKVEGTVDLDEDLIKKTIHEQVSNVIAHINPWLFLLDPVDLSLDVYTAANNLRISEDLKTASLTYVEEERPPCPDWCPRNEILSTQCFSSRRHYWEVDISKLGNWRLGVTYPYRNGAHGASWTLRRNYNQCLAVHKSSIVRLSYNLCCQRFGVYLDYEAGQLSFYLLGDPIRHLHTFTATFTEPVHALFWINNEDCAAWVKIKS